jgi:hypothetical protein
MNKNSAFIISDLVHMIKGNNMILNVHFYDALLSSNLIITWPQIT